MDPGNFNYGLGPMAIRPLNYPEMLSPGDPGYPTDQNSSDIFRIKIGKGVRAYPKMGIRPFEVVNDKIG